MAGQQHDAMDMNLANFRKEKEKVIKKCMLLQQQTDMPYA